MERLTKRNSVGVAIYKTPYACGNCNETLYRLPDYGNGSPTDKLADYEDAEENGLLKHLPCRVGDTVYEISRVEPYRNPAIREMGVVDILLRDNDMYFTLQDLYDEHYDNSILSTEIGKTVFLTESEAEQALAKMKGV